MIMIDTTPLVALCNDQDQHHARALKDLDRLSKRGIVTCAAVLTEACYHLSTPFGRRRLVDVMEDLSVTPVAEESDAGVRAEVFAWLLRYAEHGPDFTDGMLAVLSGRRRRMRVWTYDSEFSKLWRRPDGTRIPLAAV